MSSRFIGAEHEPFGLDHAGRGVDRLAGALRQGAEGWQEALKGAEEYAQVSARVDPLTADTAEHLNKLSLDLQTLSKEGRRFRLIDPLERCRQLLDVPVDDPARGVPIWR